MPVSENHAIAIVYRLVYFWRGVSQSRLSCGERLEQDIRLHFAAIMSQISLVGINFLFKSDISKPMVCQTYGLQVGGLHENDRNRKKVNQK